MYRCLLGAVAAAVLLHAPAFAQSARNFPATALRGSIAFGNAPEITLNGKAARLAPGARIREETNLLALPATLSGRSAVVNYTLEDTTGLVREVWLLTAAERAVKPWPTTPEQLSTWVFDPAGQTWTAP